MLSHEYTNDVYTQANRYQSDDLKGCAVWRLRPLRRLAAFGDPLEPNRLEADVIGLEELEKRVFLSPRQDVGRGETLEKAPGRRRSPIAEKLERGRIILP